MAAASIFQFVVAVLAPTLVTEVGISRLDLGSISASYYLAAAVASFSLGRLIDRISTGIGAILIYVLSASAFALVAALPTMGTFLVAGGTAGVAAGLSNPLTNRIIAAQSGARGVLVGVKQGGVQLSALIAGSGMPILALLCGWRTALILVAAAIVLIGMASWLYLPNQPSARAARLTEKEHLPVVIHWLCGYAFMMGAGMSAVTIYVVLYGHDEVGLSKVHAGLLLATMGLIGATARILSSIFAERGEQLSVWMAGGACAAVLGVALIAATTNPYVVWGGVAVVGSSGAAWNGVAILAVLRACPDRLTGHATGIVLTGFFVGLALGPPVFGAIVDATGSYDLGWGMAAACFAAAAVIIGASSRRHQLRHPAPADPCGV